MPHFLCSLETDYVLIRAMQELLDVRVREEQDIYVDTYLTLDDDTEELVKVCKMKLQSWGSSANSVNLKGVDILSLERDAIAYTGSSSAQYVYAKTLLNSILTTAGIDYDTTNVPSVQIPLIQCSQSASAPTTYVTRTPMDSSTTTAQAVQMLANVCRCVAYEDREGKLIIEPHYTTPEETTFDMTRDLMIGKPLGERTTKVKEVKVRVFTYLTETDEETGYKTFSAQNDSVYATASVFEKGDTVVWENPLITNSTLAQTIADWLAEYYSHNVEYVIEHRGDPTINALDYIEQESKSIDDLKTYIVENELTYNGAYGGSVVTRRALDITS